MSATSPQRAIIVALDFPQPDRALDLAGQLDPGRCRLKVGKELFCRGGPQLVSRLVEAGHEVFLDLKFHDIPNTVAAACRAAADLGVWMLNVHALGGRDMLVAAREALGDGADRPLLTAVTVLTSHGPETLREIGCQDDVQAQVLRLARLAADAGLDGMVCSAREAPALRAALGTGPVLVTPGIRTAGSAADDQCRTVTPAAALAAGSSHLVVGRPITRAADPSVALGALQAELDAVFDTGGANA